MRNIIYTFLKEYKKKTVSLSELEKQVPGNMEYNEFAEQINILVQNQVLKEINPKNNNGKNIPLCMKYGINEYELKKEYFDQIKALRLVLHDEINIDNYYKMSEINFENDKKYILKVNEYLKNNGFPENYVTSPERSFNITGDEKWIDEKGGKKLLQRISVYDKLKIMDNNDPVMFAINNQNIDDEVHYHLIVENKATFLALMEYIKDTKLTTLILGYGWKITGNIFMLDKQLGLNGKNEYYYFGDLDNEGISIYSSLSERIELKLAAEFYREMLKKPYSKGKTNQNQNRDALKKFLNNFNNEESQRITKLLSDGKYMPQEALNKKELENIVKNMI